MKGLYIAFFLLIFVVSCKKEERPKGILAEPQLIALLTDIHLVDGYTNSVVVDTVRLYGPGLYRAVFKKHRIDSAGLRKNLEYYSHRPLQFRAMYDKIKGNLSRIQKQEEKRQSKKPVK